MTPEDAAKVNSFLQENDPDIKDNEYQNLGLSNESRAQLRRINEAIVGQSPEEILDYINSGA
jgi:hypothetical protein